MDDSEGGSGTGKNAQSRDPSPARCGRGSIRFRALLLVAGLFVGLLIRGTDEEEKPSEEVEGQGGAEEVESLSVGEEAEALWG